MIDTWTKIMKLKSKDTRHKGVANTLTDDDIATIIATTEYFGAELSDMKQMYFDLKVAKYRVFDWLAMGVGGRIDNKPGLKVLIHSFIKCDGDIDKWIDDLRVTDYEMVRDWEDLDLINEIWEDK